MRVDYFDLDGDRLKTLSFGDYRQYKDQFWRPHELTMDSFLTGKSTIMRYENYRFETGLSERECWRRSESESICRSGEERKKAPRG
jgi:hypothetical protein